MRRGEEQAVRRGDVRLLILFCAQMIGDHGIHTDAESDGDRADQILNRVYERQSGQRVLADRRDKKTVDDVVERVYEHRDHHRESHARQQREHRALSHKSFIHKKPPSAVWLHKKSHTITA